MTTSLKLSSYSVIVRVSVVLKRTVVGDYSTNYFQRLTLESWFTKLRTDASQQMSTVTSTLQTTP